MDSNRPLSHRETIYVALFNSDLFAGALPSQIEKVVPVASLLFFKPEEYLFRAQEKASGLYVLSDGAVIPEYPRVEGAVESEVFGPGMAIGWRALLRDEAHHLFSARAATAGGAVCIPTAAFRVLLRQEPELSALVNRNLVQMLTNRCETLFNQLLESRRRSFPRPVGVPTDFSERRKAPRIDLQLSGTMRLKLGEQEVEKNVLTKNMNAYGAYLLTELGPPVGAQVWLHLQWSPRAESSETEKEILGTVLRTERLSDQQYGFAYGFASNFPHLQEPVRRYLLAALVNVSGLVPARW